MGQFCVLIVIPFCLFLHVKAQKASNSEPDVLHPLRPSVAVFIGVLSIGLSLLFLVLAYTKFCQSTPFYYMNSALHRQNLQELDPSRSRFSGIDKELIESLPVFRFSSLKGSKEGLECAVCLSRFEDTENLRLLPKCRHAFHMNCIDKWLEGHASCPLCRCKFDIRDVRSFSYSNSLRFLGIPSNLTEEPNLEIFVRREEDRQGSSRFSSFRKIEQNKKQEELLIEEGNRTNVDRKLLHKFKHKIVVSEVVNKNRWSDVNSSDVLFLNSEMISVMSSDRFSRLNTSSGRFNNCFSMNDDNMDKIKEDIERKRLYEAKFGVTDRSLSIPDSRISSSYYNDENSSKTLNDTEKRSMSEITNFSRFRESNIKQNVKETATGGDGNRKEERIRRLWLPIMQRTVQWFSGSERNLQELDQKRHNLNV